MSRKVPEKGKPDFSNLGKDRLSDYRDMISNMIGAYSHDREKADLLRTVWKELNEEAMARMSVGSPAARVSDKPVKSASRIVSRRRSNFRTSRALDLTK